MSSSYLIVVQGIIISRSLNIVSAFLKKTVKMSKKKFDYRSTLKLMKAF